MNEGANVRSVLFSLDMEEMEVKVVASMLDQIEVKETEVRLGTWTQPLYICSKVTVCSFGTECQHGRPHKEKISCRSQWTQILGIRPNAVFTEWDHVTRTIVDVTNVWRQTHYENNSSGMFEYRSRTGRWCSNCVAIPGSRKFIPMAKANLKENQGKVICPSAIPSCVGRCSHATPHAKSKFCKDLFPNEEAKLQCRAVNSQKHGSRGLLFDAPKLACQI